MEILPGQGGFEPIVKGGSRGVASVGNGRAKLVYRILFRIINL